MTTARWALGGWAVLSAAWVGGVVSRDSLGRDPATWTAVCALVSGMLATLLVFVVTLAPLWLQMQPNRPVRLARNVLDSSAVGYAAFFISGAVLPVLGVAEPSRPMALLAVGLVAPVIGSLVPAVLFFTHRLRSDWSLHRPVKKAVVALGRYGHDRGRRRSGRGRSEYQVLRSCRVAAEALKLMLVHGRESLDDRDAARLYGRRLFTKALEVDTVGTRAFVVDHMSDLVTLAAKQGPASLRHDVAVILVSCAEQAGQSTGGDVVRTAIDGVLRMGRSADAGLEERLDLAEKVACIVKTAASATAVEVKPLDTGERPENPGPAHARGPVRFRLQESVVRGDAVLEQGVEAISELIGPPARPVDGSRHAWVHADVFARGCTVFSTLAENLLKRDLWVSYGDILDRLEDWLCHRLGSGPDRSDDLNERAPQRAPYAREAEAVAGALVAVAVRAHEKAFDHVTRAALAVLVRGTEMAMRRDPTAFVLYARALDQARSRLFGPPYGPRELAGHARAVELLLSLQRENRRLLAQLTETESPSGGEEPRQLEAQEETPRNAAVRHVLRWALRPWSHTEGGVGRLRLEIARNAQSLRRKGEVPWDNSRDRPYDDSLVRRELRAFDLWSSYELDSDPRIALIQVIRPDDCDDPGLAVHAAAVRWREALATARTEGGQGRYAREFLARLAGAEKLSSLAATTPECETFGARIRSWAEAPWCPTDVSAPHYGVPDADALTHIPAAEDAATADIRILLQHHQAQYGLRMNKAGCSSAEVEDRQSAGALWGEWPPPPGFSDNPLNVPSRSVTERIGLDAYRHDDEGMERRRPDRVYQGRSSGPHRIVVTEPDGSRRVLRGVDHQPGGFTLYPGGTARTILGERLAADVLGSLSACPACHGGSAGDGWPGWCRTCRGLRKHPHLGLAQLAMEEAVRGIGPEWTFTRTQLLDAIVSYGR